jgi:cytochrome d ubiquinol oxidase subunit II
MMLDYETLRLLWWALLGVLLIGFAVMDGFDLGVAMLHPFVPQTETQRRVMLNTIGPVWEGNQVWFILGGGAVFAAWPLLYSASFSGFYLAMLLVLLGLILRPVSLVFRSKSPPEWRKNWDVAFFLSGFVPSLVFGVAFGNLLRGTPFHFDETLQLVYEGNLFGLLNPFALLCGLVSVAMLTMQGAAFLAGKAEGEVAQRARVFGVRAALALIALFALAGLWVAFGQEGYVIHGAVDHAGPSNPMLKSVTRETGAWLANYYAMPATLAAPVAAFAFTLLAAVLLAASWAKTALVASSLAVAGVVTTAGVSLFPFLMPSLSRPDHSLTLWDASSSQRTLGIMLVAVVIFLPLVLAYTTWVYYMLRGPVTEVAIEREDDYSY